MGRERDTDQIEPRRQTLNEMGVLVRENQALKEHTSRVISRNKARVAVTCIVIGFVVVDVCMRGQVNTLHEVALGFSMFNLGLIALNELFAKDTLPKIQNHQQEMIDSLYREANDDS